MDQERKNPLLADQTDSYSQEYRNLQEVVLTPNLPLKRILSRIGMALVFMALATLASQFLIVRWVYRYMPEVYSSNWFAIIISAITTAGIGYPIFIAMVHKIPDTPKEEVKELSKGQFLGAFFVCIAFMYITNFITTMILVVVSIAKNQELVNPVEVLINNSNMYLNIAYVVLIGPIMEEIVFRKYLLNKLRWFGDLPAILISGVAFGLFHMNLNQFLYATTLGFVFAYVALRTNTIRYNIILHIMINSIGILAAQIALGGNAGILGVFFLWIIFSIVMGIVLFAKYKHRIMLKKVISDWKKRDYFRNIGTLLYLLLCIGIIVYELL